MQLLALLLIHALVRCLLHSVVQESILKVALSQYEPCTRRIISPNQKLLE